jgi:hypothetical protein
MKKSTFCNYDTVSHAGIHLFQWVMDSRLRGSNGFRIFCDSIKETEPNENALVPLHPAHLFPSTPSMLGAGQRERRKSKAKKPLFSPCLGECAKNFTICRMRFD